MFGSTGRSQSSCSRLSHKQSLFDSLFYDFSFSEIELWGGSGAWGGVLLDYIKEVSPQNRDLCCIYQAKMHLKFSQNLSSSKNLKNSVFADILTKNALSCQKSLIAKFVEFHALR